MSFISIFILVLIAVVGLFILGSIFSFLFSIALPVLIIAGIIWLIYRHHNNKNGPTDNSNQNYSGSTTSNSTRKKARNVKTEDIED